jgi:hypothetical protein
MPTGQAAQRKLQPLTISIQNSNAGLAFSEGAPMFGYISLTSLDLMEEGTSLATVDVDTIWLA